MNMDLMTPKENLNGMTTKDAILYILSQAWPLSARKIYHEIKNKGNGKSISYQAVHKTLKSLENSGIIERSGKNYKISSEWIEKTEKFISGLKDMYSRNENGLNIPDSSHFVFNTMYEVDKFITEFGESVARNLKGETPMICTHWRHLWIPLFLDKKIYKSMKDFTNAVKYYEIISYDSTVDKWCHKFWSKFEKMHIVCGVGDLGVSDYVVMGDYVMQVFYPHGLMKEMDEIYFSAKSIHDLDHNKLFERIFEKKTTIPVTITKNPMLAEQLRNRILSYFKKNVK